MQVLDNNVDYFYKSFKTKQQFYKISKIQKNSGTKDFTNKHFKDKYIFLRIINIVLNTITASHYLQECDIVQLTYL